MVCTIHLPCIFKGLLQSLQEKQNLPEGHLVDFYFSGEPIIFLTKVGLDLSPSLPPAECWDTQKRKELMFCFHFGVIGVREASFIFTRHYLGIARKGGGGLNACPDGWGQHFREEFA